MRNVILSPANNFTTIASQSVSFSKLFIFLILISVSGCSSIRPPANLSEEIKNSAAISPPPSFSYQTYEVLLQEFVDENGSVDYRRLVENKHLVDGFYAQIASFSPDSHPELFKEKNDKLAYWINAYNATVIKGVVEHYPISSVADVQEPLLLFFFPEKSGFFLFQRFTYGSAETSLYNLENGVIRKRFVDPRFHFGLNCASSSCPQLPKEPFLPHILDAQLDRETKKFINDKRNVRYDKSSNTLYLSSIFKWYEQDFLKWLRQEKGFNNPSLIDYILIFADDILREVITNTATLQIAFLHYDWSLNDQRATR